VRRLQVSSPVDPSRRTALVQALNEAEMQVTAGMVDGGRLVDLGVVVVRLGVFGRAMGPRWRSKARAEALASAIEAGEYGPYQETGDGR